MNKRKEGKMSTVTFDKESADFVMEAFPDVERICYMCTNPVKASNLAGVVSDNGTPRFLCENTECLRDYGKYVQIRRLKEKQV